MKMFFQEHFQEDGDSLEISKQVFRGLLLKPGPEKRGKLLDMEKQLEDHIL